MKTAEEIGAIFAAEYRECNNMQTAVNLKVLRQHWSLLETKKRILELGCGSGRIAHFLAEQLPGAHITATDKSDSLIQQAEQQYQLPNLTFKTLDADDIKDLQKYDCILCFFLLHFIPTRDQVFKSMLDALSADGDLLVIIPIEDSKMLAVRQAVFSELVAEQPERFYKAPAIKGINTDSDPYRLMTVSCAEAKFNMHDRTYDPKMTPAEFAKFYRGIGIELRTLRLTDVEKQQYVQKVVERMPKRSNGDIDFTLHYFDLSAKKQFSITSQSMFSNTCLPSHTTQVRHADSVESSQTIDHEEHAYKL